MDFNIRQEQIKDYEAVHKVVELAFRDMEDSDHNDLFSRSTTSNRRFYPRAFIGCRG